MGSLHETKYCPPQLRVLGCCTMPVSFGNVASWLVGSHSLPTVARARRSQAVLQIHAASSEKSQQSTGTVSTMVILRIYSSSTTHAFDRVRL